MTCVYGLPHAAVATVTLGTGKSTTLRLVLLLQGPDDFKVDTAAAALELLSGVSNLASLWPLPDLLVVVLRDLAKVHMRACLVVLMLYLGYSTFIHH